jgi:Tfp pilus assembly protein PilN
MRIVPVPENMWSIEIAGYDLSMRFVRTFMRRQRVLRDVSIPGFGTLTDAGKQEKLLSVLGRQAKWTRAVLSLPRDQAVVRQLQLPVEAQHDMRSALTLQIEAISAWQEQDVYWDYLVEVAKDNPGMLMVTVAIVPKRILDPWLRLFDSIRAPLSGASVRGLDVNVVPIPLRRRSARAQTVTAYALAVCTFFLGAAFFLREPYQQRVYAAQIQSEIVRLEPDVKGLVRQEGELDVLTRRYQSLLKGLQNRDSNLEALKTLATALPADTFVMNYRYQNETVTISGVSRSALEIQDALEKSPVFKDVQFAAPITRDMSGKDRFTLKMSVEAGP